MLEDENIVWIDNIFRIILFIDRDVLSMEVSSSSKQNVWYVSEFIFSKVSS